jgi:hypothetical protein
MTRVTHLEHALENGTLDSIPTVKQMLTETFAQVATGSFTRRDGTVIDYRYDALPIADNKYGLVIDGMGIREYDGDDTFASRGSIEIRVRDLNKLESSSGYVTIYGPELETYGLGDEPAAVKEAYPSWSSGGGDDIDEAIAGSVMLGLAATIARKWTEDDRPKLEKLAKVKHAKRLAREKERQEERAAKQAKFDRIVDEGNTVRVTVRNKKVPLVGILQNKDRERLVFELALSYKFEPVKVFFSDVEKMETKLTGTNRFDEIAF